MVAVGAVLAPVPVLGGLLMLLLVLLAWRHPGVALVALLALLPFNVAIFIALANKAGAHVGRLGDWKDALIVLLFVRGIVARRAREGQLRMPEGAFNRFLIAYVLFYCLLAAASPHFTPAIYTLSRDVEGPLLFLAILCLRPSRRTVLACLFVWLAASTIIGAAAVYEHLGPRVGFELWYGAARPPLGSSFYPSASGWRSGSFLDSPLILAFYLAVTAPLAVGCLFAYRRWRGVPLLAAAATAASIAGILFAETRSGYLGAGGGVLAVLFLALRNRPVRTALVGIFVIAVAVAVITNQNTSAITRPGEDSSKRHAWVHDFDVIASKPLGVGLGSIDMVGQKFGVSANGATASESELLARGVEGGAAALLLYPSCLLLLVLYLLRVRRRAFAADDAVSVALAAGAMGAAIAVLLAGLFLGVDELVVEVGVWAPAALAVVWYRGGLGGAAQRALPARARLMQPAPLLTPTRPAIAAGPAEPRLGPATPPVPVAAPFEPGHATIIVSPADDTGQLSRCLQAIGSLDYPAYDVVLLDDAAATAGKPAVEPVMPPSSVPVRVAPVPGSLAALREWVQSEVRGEVLAFLDSDCAADRGWLRAGVDALERRPGIDLVVGRTLREPSGLSDSEASVGLETGSCNMFLRTDVFRARASEDAFAWAWEQGAAGVVPSSDDWEAVYEPGALAWRYESPVAAPVPVEALVPVVPGEPHAPDPERERRPSLVELRRDPTAFGAIAGIALARRRPRLAAALAAPFVARALGRLSRRIRHSS